MKSLTLMGVSLIFALLLTSFIHLPISSDIKNEEVGMIMKIKKNVCSSDDVRCITMEVTSLAWVTGNIAMSLGDQTINSNGQNPFTGTFCFHAPEIGGKKYSALITCSDGFNEDGCIIVIDSCK